MFVFLNFFVSGFFVTCWSLIDRIIWKRIYTSFEYSLHIRDRIFEFLFNGLFGCLRNAVLRMQMVCLKQTSECFTRNHASFCCCIICMVRETNLFFTINIYLWILKRLIIYTLYMDVLINLAAWNKVYNVSIRSRQFAINCRIICGK